MKKRVLYINRDWGNLASLDSHGDALESELFNVSWRELLFDIIGEDPQAEDLDSCLEDYGIEPSDLDERIPDNVAENYYSQIAFLFDNFTGAEADAFQLIRSLDLFPMDKDGNGSSNGVELAQSTANGPCKSVYIEDENAAEWLRGQFESRSLDIDVCFV